MEINQCLTGLVFLQLPVQLALDFEKGLSLLLLKKKCEMETSFLSSIGNETSDDSDSPSVRDSFQWFDKSYGIHLNDDEDNNVLHDNSVFVAMRDAETSFTLSPDSFFYTSFVRRNDTLVIMAEDSKIMLNECSVSRKSRALPSPV